MARDTSQDNYYIAPAAFKAALREYYETGVMKDSLAEMIPKIANGLSLKNNFVNYTYRDEMVGDAIVKMYAALKGKKYSFSTESNPFSYFTTIAFNAFINRIKKEKKHTDTLREYKEKMYEELLTEGHEGIYVKPNHDDDDDSYYA